jgi:hypothetical protein
MADPEAQARVFMDVTTEREPLDRALAATVDHDPDGRQSGCLTDERELPQEETPSTLLSPPRWRIAGW